tara:strand:+ start:217 stop:1809 length:1593 start_codon:yes stop_codon:yes gene_type:complete
MFTQNVSVPHSFFKKSKREYDSWTFAFFRELLQNSIDAGSKNIDININQSEESVIVGFSDDGIGMDEHTLVNAFLALGGSHKEDNSIGGFGYAKTLILFAHKNYSVKTRNLIVKGSGGKYNIDTSGNYLGGTKIEVEMDMSDGYEVRKNILESELLRVIDNSKLEVKIKLNDELLKVKSKKYSYEYDTPIGKLNFSDAEEDYISSLWVRVNGLAMFSHRVYSESETNFSGCIDLNKDPIEVLTSNRDSLKGSSKREFNEIFEKLQKERSSLKSEKTNNFVINEKEISNVYITSDDGWVEQDKPLMSERKGGSECRYSSNKEEDQVKSEMPKFSPFKKLVEQSESKLEKIQVELNKVGQSSYPYNFNLKNNSLTPAQMRNELNKSFLKNLSFLWSNIVYSVLESLNSSRDLGVTFVDSEGSVSKRVSELSNVSYAKIGNRKVFAGFVFDKMVRALNASNKEQIVIYVNPLIVKEMNKEGDNSISNLCDLAIHEIAHIFNEDHNERFCSIEMDIRWGLKKYYGLQDWKKLIR